MASTGALEGLVLRLPENLPPTPVLSYEQAVQLLIRAAQQADRTPFTWGYIDQPVEGSMYLVFITNNVTFVADGVRFQDVDTRYTLPSPGAGGGAPLQRELEVFETKHGFIPGKDQVANRVRRRFRLAKGGHPQFALYHYSRGPNAPIVPSLLNAPIRSYPLRQPPDAGIGIFVLGSRTGHKVQLGGGALQAPGAASTMPPVGQHAQLATQNRNLEEMERRRLMEMQRARQAAPGQPQQRPRPKEDDEDEEESEHVSTRSIALTRYRRNHELMDEIFMQAAFGEKTRPTPPKPYSIFDETECNTRIDSLEKEIEELRSAKANKRTSIAA